MTSPATVVLRLLLFGSNRVIGLQKEALGQVDILANAVGSFVAHELRRLLLSRVLPSSIHP